MATLRVKEPFAVDMGGIQRVLRAGDLIDESDPIVTKGRRQFFELVEVAVVRERHRVEQASAAPGEKRTVTRRATKKAAAAAARAPVKVEPKAEPKTDSKVDGNGDAAAK